MQFKTSNDYVQCDVGCTGIKREKNVPWYKKT